MTGSPPVLPLYGRQIFICTNGNCAAPETSLALLSQLRQLNRDHGRDRLSNPERIHVVPCGCLGVCIAGPLLVVYPDGIWYHEVDSAKLERIYREHLLAGRPVAEWIYHRHYPAGMEPPYAPDLRQDAAPDPLQAAAERAAAEKEAERKRAREEPLPDQVRAARERRRRRRGRGQTE